MAKKEIGTLLRDYPQRFALNDYGLSNLFCYAGIGIDNHILGWTTAFSEDEYRAAMRVGRILYQYAEETKARTQGHPEKINPIEDVFLFKVLRELGQNPKTIEDVANSTIQLGLDFIKIRELPRKRQEELRSICVLLSRRSGDYWHELNPNGFGRYAA